MGQATLFDTLEIFASYSHRDEKFVKPMIQYLRPTGAVVFRDGDAIPPGKKWAVVIAEAIEGCRIMYIFWCAHSANSGEVRKEWERAIFLRKDIVPVLLDDTPLPGNLAEYQWVDLRVVIGKHEDVVEQTLSRKEGRVHQQLDRELRAGVDEYYDGDFFRQGWQERDNKYVRKARVVRPIPDAAVHEAAALLSEDLERRLKSV